MPTKEPAQSPERSQSEERRVAAKDPRHAGQHDRRVVLHEHDQSGTEASHRRGEPAHPAATEQHNEADDPQNGHGPYNRGGQFEATEKNGDMPSTQVSRGAHKSDPQGWQDEARQPAKPSSEKK
jgi:hypothetical protein